MYYHHNVIVISPIRIQIHRPLHNMVIDENPSECPYKLQPFIYYNRKARVTRQFYGGAIQVNCPQIWNSLSRTDLLFRTA